MAKSAAKRANDRTKATVRGRRLPKAKTSTSLLDEAQRIGLLVGPVSHASQIARVFAALERWRARNPRSPRARSAPLHRDVATYVLDCAPGATGVSLRVAAGLLRDAVQKGGRVRVVIDFSPAEESRSALRSRRGLEKLK